MSGRAVQIVVVLLLLLVAAGGVYQAVEARRPKGSDVAQLQQILLDGEAAAEQKNAAGIARFLSKDYKDDLGMSDTSLGYQIREYLRQARTVDVTIPTESIQIQVSPDGKTGSVNFRVAISTQGDRGGGGAETQMSLQVAKEPVHYFGVFPGQEWRVTSAGGYAALE